MWLCNILRRDRALGPPVRSEGFLSSSFFIYRRLVSIALWHSRLGHASISRVKQLVSRGLLDSVSNKRFYCMPCQFGKQTSLPFNNNVSHDLSSFDLIHFDI